MAEATSTVQKQPSQWTNFFGNVLGTIGETAKEVVPNWTAKQLGMQSEDQLEKETFNVDAAQQRVDTISTPLGVGAMKQPAFSIGGFSVSYMMLAFGFGAVLLLGLYLKR